MHDHPPSVTADFDQQPDIDLPTEFIHGEVIVSQVPKDDHQLVVNRIFALFVHKGQTEYVRTLPSTVQFSDDVVIQPDLFWIDPQSERCQLIEGYWHGAPDLVVEVLSPTSLRIDRSAKFEIYRQFGVNEYWMIDPLVRQVEVWGRPEPEDDLLQRGIFGPDDSFTSNTLNTTIPLNAVFN